MEINSMSNAKVKKWMKYHSKKYRDEDHMFLIEGEHLIEEAIQANALDVLIIRKGNQNIFNFDGDLYEVSNEVMDKLSKNVSSVQYIGVCRQLNLPMDKEEKVILLDNVQDPGNVGTILRTAYSFGYDAVYLSEGCADVYNEKVIRATQGALFHLPVYQKKLENEIERLKKKKVKVYATSLHEAKFLSTMEKENAVALVFGNEGQGVRDKIIQMCDTSIKIEMDAFESLNVAIAAGICMYYFK